MAPHLQKIENQVIVLIGASSGIGLATAETAAKKGARLVLAARSEHALNDIVDRIRASGGEAIAVPCDVADRGQVENVASRAIQEFGRIDSWVNIAGLGIYGRADQIDEADGKRLFDVNFWGVVNGCLAALPHLKGRGGALITVGSEVSEAAAPLMSLYVASKHAVKGYIDVLRMETENIDKVPVAITLIQPTAVDTPFPQHARNYMDQEPKLPPPTIDPTQVADAILEAAVHPTREKRVGSLAKVNTFVAKFFPGLADRMGANRVEDLKYNEPPRNPQGALNQPSEAIHVVARTHGTGGQESK